MRRWLLGPVCVALMAGTMHAQQIPARPGLVLDYSHKQTDREYDKQFMVTIVAVDTNETIFRSYFLDDLKTSRPIFLDTVSRREWLGARAVGVGAGTDSLERIRNRTIMTLSKRVYQQLKRDGRIDEVASYVVMPDVSMIYRVQGSQQLVGAGPETLTVVIDGRPRTVPALHTKGRLARFVPPILDLTVENWYLDDPDAAWVLRIEQVINGKDYHVRLGTVSTSPADGAKQLDAALGAACRAQMYGIYFAYNSAEVTPVSEPTLAQVALVLKQHGDWTLTIEGHTDSIGGAKYNQELSARRAAAVKERLVSHYGIGASRLKTDGVGLARPLAPNGTLEGRARNRRVELVRPCAGKE